MWTEEQTSDEILTDRVRTVLGRVISHPRSVEISAENGWIAVEGAILAFEERRLLNRIRKVRGVRGIHNNLEVFRSADHISRLQGGVPRQERFELMQTNWSPAARFFGVAGGAAAALYAWRRRDIAGVAPGILGLVLATRAVTNKDLTHLLCKQLSSAETQTPEKTA
jgi:hypothetical protein